MTVNTLKEKLWFCRSYVPDCLLAGSILPGKKQNTEAKLYTECMKFCWRLLLAHLQSQMS